MIFHVPQILYKDYKLKLKFVNQGDKVDRDIFEHNIVFEVAYINKVCELTSDNNC
jgi:hypothetical protein